MVLENLEDRAVPAAVTWVGGNTGVWEQATNWSTQKVPTSADDVTINTGAAGTIRITQSGDAVHSVTTNGNAALQVNIGGSLQIGNGTSALGGGLDIVPGASVTINAGATVGVDTHPIVLDGSLTINSGSTVTFTGGTNMFPNGIEDDGLLTVSSSKMITSGGVSPLDIFQGGRMIATNSTFSMYAVDYDYNGVLTASDLAGNDFSGSGNFGLDPLQVPLVTNNKFGNVDLYANGVQSDNTGPVPDGLLDNDTLPSGNNLTLPLLTSGASKSFYYDFVDDYTVAAGATLTFAAKVPVVFDYITSAGLEGSTLRVNGLVRFNNDSVQFYTNPADKSPVGQMQVFGTVSTNTTTFSDVTGSNGTRIIVGSGGLMAGSGNTFAVDRTVFTDNAQLVTNGVFALTGNDFSSTVVDIRASSVPAIVNNLAFGEVDLRTGALGASSTDPTTLELTKMGTRSTAGLFYVFNGDYTVDAGYTLIIDPGLTLDLYSLAFINNALRQSGNTLTIDGTIKFGVTLDGTTSTAPVLFNFYTVPTTTSDTYIYPVSQLNVDKGGVFQATNTNFLNLPGYYTEMTFAGGSYLSGTGDDFAASYTLISDGVILNSDTTQTTSSANALTGDEFANTYLQLPTLDLPLIGNNKQFSTIGLLAVPGGLSSNISLLPIGTVSVSTLNYQLLTNVNPTSGQAIPYTINAGATVTVSPNLIVGADGQAPLAVNGTLNFAQGDNLSLYNVNVGNGGVLQLPDLTLTLGGQFSFGPSPYAVTVSSGGTFTTVGSTLNANLVFGPGSFASMTLSSLIGTLTVDQTTMGPGSTASAPLPVVITKNNFTAVGADGIIATGNSTATPNNNPAKIYLTGNYWGTTNVTAIGLKIKDHGTGANDPDTQDSPTLPTIVFQPFVNSTSVTTGQDVTAVYGSSDQTVTLTAAVDATVGTISEGTVTFAIYNGTTLIGTAQTVSESNGTATTSYTIPGGTPVGSYTIQVTYNGTANYLPSIDSSHHLTITQATATVAGPASGSVSTTYSNVAGTTVLLPATVTSTAGVVNEGTVTFTVYTSGTNPTQVGQTVTANVTNGSASGTFSLPVGTPAGTYTVSVGFDGSQDYAASTTPSTFNLIVTPAATAVAATNASATFSTASQNLTLSGTVTSAAGVVNEGTLTFTVVSSAGTTLGTAVTVSVVNGKATATYALPGGATVGNDLILVTYADPSGTDPTTGAITGNFASQTTTATLTIGQATTSITVSSAQATFNTAPQPVTLTANVASGNAAVNEGTVSFGVFDSGGNLIGSVVVANVVAGVATASYTLPANLPVGSTYNIRALYNGSTDYISATATGGSLTIIQATTTVGAAIAPVTYSPSAQQALLHGVVLDNGVPVTEGSVTFSVYAGSTLLGTTAAVGLDATGNAYSNFTIPAGTKAGTVLTVTANYGGTGNYSTGTANNSTTIAQATPTVTYNAPRALVYGQPLTATQLNATASVPGTFTYSPSTGTLLNTGVQNLTATFVPTDTVDYTNATASSTIDVLPGNTTVDLLAPSQSIQLHTPVAVFFGRVSTPYAIPVGQRVTVFLTSGTQSASGAATINPDGTFATAVNTSGLSVGVYEVDYSYLGDANFVGDVGVPGGTLTVTQASQTIPTYTVPASAEFGTSFTINPTSSSGLPVIITASNAQVAISPSGGYIITPTSGTLPVVLVATQPGDGNYLAATATVETVATTRAKASIVIVPNFGIVYDGLPHGVGATTNPPGLATSVTYTLNGVPVAAPTNPGNYLVTGTITDPNYQGTALSALDIVPAITTSPSGGTGTTPVATVSLAGITLTTASKGKTITAINVTYTGPLTQGLAANLGNYRLATAGTKGSFDAKNAKTYRFATLSYNQATNTITLQLAKPQKLGLAYQLRISNVTGATINASINKKGGISF